MEVVEPNLVTFQGKVLHCSCLGNERINTLTGSVHMPGVGGGGIWGACNGWRSWLVPGSVWIEGTPELSAMGCGCAKLDSSKCEGPPQPMFPAERVLR